MADFTRFISYLYDYKNDTRNRNLGFVKVEARQGTCRIGLSLNHGQVLGREMTLYGYVVKPEETEERIGLVKLGTMEKGSRERRWTFPMEYLTGKGIRLEQFAGLILLGEDRESFLLSVWSDGPWTTREICQGKRWDESSSKNESILEIDSAPEEESIPKDELVLENESIPEEESIPKDELILANESAPASDGWTRLCSLFPAARPFEPSAWEVLCISLQDIGRLPPENWAWGSNHFLLHGFYQYHHLILARQRNENRIYLGVPGEFGTNEKFMAAMFGLHHFQRERRGKSNKGYWLTPIRL